MERVSFATLAAGQPPTGTAAQEAKDCRWGTPAGFKCFSGLENVELAKAFRDIFLPEKVNMPKSHRLPSEDPETIPYDKGVAKPCGKGNPPAPGPQGCQSPNDGNILGKDPPQMGPAQAVGHPYVSADESGGGALFRSAWGRREPRGLSGKPKNHWGDCRIALTGKRMRGIGNFMKRSSCLRKTLTKHRTAVTILLRPRSPKRRFRMFLTEPG